MSEATSRAEMEQRLIQRSLEDDVFRQQLLADPRAIIERELGTQLPEEVRVVAVEETADTIYLVLPSASAGRRGGRRALRPGARDGGRRLESSGGSCSGIPVGANYTTGVLPGGIRSVNLHSAAPCATTAAVRPLNSQGRRGFLHPARCSRPARRSVRRGSSTTPRRSLPQEHRREQVGAGHA